MAYFEIQAMIRGYHQYKRIWDAKFGEQLECQRETGNPHDIFAVAVLKSGTGVVGHIPKHIRLNNFRACNHVHTLMGMAH